MDEQKTNEGLEAQDQAAAADEGPDQGQQAPPEPALNLTALEELVSVVEPIANAVRVCLGGLREGTVFPDLGVYVERPKSGGLVDAQGREAADLLLVSFLVPIAHGMKVATAFERAKLTPPAASLERKLGRRLGSVRVVRPQPSGQNQGTPS